VPSAMSELATTKSNDSARVRSMWFLEAKRATLTHP
jgi:hypothetical protein